MSEVQTPGIGHNLPPEEKDAQQFDARVTDISNAANEWLRRAPEIRTDDEAQRCRDFLAQLAAEIKAAEAARTKHKAPYRAAADAVETRFKGIVGRCQKGVDLLSPRMTAWLQKLDAERKERERVAREAADKAKADAEQAAADAAKVAAEAKGDIVGAAVAADEAAAAAVKAERDAKRVEKERPKVAGNFAPRAMSLRTTWSAEIEDYDKALAHFAQMPSVRDAVQQAANAAARVLKGTQPIPGCKQVSTQSV